MKTRYRQQTIKRLFGPDQLVLVLQVYASWPEGDHDMHGMPNRLAGSGWRNATVEDLTEQSNATLEKP